MAGWWLYTDGALPAICTELSSLDCAPVMHAVGCLDEDDQPLAGDDCIDSKEYLAFFNTPEIPIRLYGDLSCSVLCEVSCTKDGEATEGSAMISLVRGDGETIPDSSSVMELPAAGPHCLIADITSLQTLSSCSVGISSDLFTCSEVYRVILSVVTGVEEDAGTEDLVLELSG